ncbi:thioredoxin family protein [Namhaeicola litoreus]|uniref:Thioredoxin family protein n=1 Tax=Namhaeicola litoreus TaxID=1052145 RepID=A0ABW3Y695_9FLAO
MARTPSNMLALGTKASEFELIDTVTGKDINLSSLKGERATVIYFICNHCPFVLHTIEELVDIAKVYDDFGFSFVAISSNDIVNYPEDSPENMKKFARKNDFQFPYLFDETQDVARAYKAACTPDIFVFDRGLELVYRGQLDDSRPGNGIPVTGKDLRRALQNILDGKAVDEVQKPSIGCNIKWK